MTPVPTSGITPAVAIVEGKPTTTSLDIAAHFGKDHKNVLRTIDQLECSAAFRALNLYPSTWAVPVPNGGTRQTRIYRLTRDGFTFVAMGFTGPHAARWKEAYIQAFNWMEESLAKAVRHPGAPLVPPAEMRRAVNARAWALAQANFQRYQREILEVAKSGDMGRVLTWAPPETRLKDPVAVEFETLKQLTEAAEIGATAERVKQSIRQHVEPLTVELAAQCGRPLRDNPQLPT